MDDWDKHSSRIFPTLAKCDFYNFGHSGSMQKRDGLCILPLNILNEKLFAFLWLWYMFLLIVTIFNVMYRLFLYSCKSYRHYLLMARARTITSDRIKVVTKNGKIGEWFILYKISNNCNPIIFTDILEQLYLRNAAVNKSFELNPI